MPIYGYAKNPNCWTKLGIFLKWQNSSNFRFFTFRIFFQQCLYNQTLKIISSIFKVLLQFQTSYTANVVSTFYQQNLQCIDCCHCFMNYSVYCLVSTIDIFLYIPESVSSYIFKSSRQKHGIGDNFNRFEKQWTICS